MYGRTLPDESTDARMSISIEDEKVPTQLANERNRSIIDNAICMFRRLSMNTSEYVRIYQSLSLARPCNSVYVRNNDVKLGPVDKGGVYSVSNCFTSYHRNNGKIVGGVEIVGDGIHMMELRELRVGMASLNVYSIVGDFSKVYIGGK